MFFKNYYIKVLETVTALLRLVSNIQQYMWSTSFINITC